MNVGQAQGGLRLPAQRRVGGVVAVKNKYIELSARVLPPWAVNNSSAARLEAQLEELTSANTDYAKETREQRRQIQRLESQNNELRLELHRLRSDRS